MCDLLDVSRAGYYDWIERPPSASSIDRDKIVQAIRQAHVESHCRYGSPNIHRHLLEKGISCCLNTVARRMKEQGIASVVGRKFRVTTTDSNHDHPVFENHLDREFAATAPNQKWAADITYIHTDEGLLYLAGVVDLFSRKIIGWSMKDTLHTDLCAEALWRWPWPAEGQSIRSCITLTAVASTPASSISTSWLSLTCGAA